MPIPAIQAIIQGAPIRVEMKAPQGPGGKSAYQIAVENGFVGTEAQWLASLVGPNTVTSATTTNFTSGNVLFANSGFVGSLSRSGIDTRASFPNADVTAATSSSTAGTIVKRDGDGQISLASSNVEGITLDVVNSGNPDSNNAIAIQAQATGSLGIAGYFVSTSGTAIIATSTTGTYHARFGDSGENRSAIERVRGWFVWFYSTFTGRLKTANITANRDWTLPNASGTIALTTDIVDSVTSATTSDGTATLSIANLEVVGGEIYTDGEYSHIYTQGDGAEIFTIGTDAKIYTQGADAHISTSGDSATIYTSGTSGSIYTIGANAGISTAGANATMGTTGANATISTTGSAAHIQTTHASAAVKSTKFAAVDSGGASLVDGSFQPCLTWSAGGRNLTIPSGTATTFNTTSYTFGTGAASAFVTALGTFNSSTATALQNSRNIFGIAFNGTANVAGDATNTGHFASIPTGGQAGHFVTLNGTAPTVVAGRSAWWSDGSGNPSFRNGTGTAVTLVKSSNLGTNVATFLATPSSANLAAAVTDETGSGSLVFATSPTLTTTTIAGLTLSGLVTHSGGYSQTGGANFNVAVTTAANLTATGSGTVTVGGAGGSTINGGTLTLSPSGFAYGAGVAATHRTALGLTTLATTTPAANVATFLATPTSANLASALTDENGTGGGFVRAEGASLTTPTLVGTPVFNATAYTYGTGAAAAHRDALGVAGKQSKTTTSAVTSTNAVAADISDLAGFALEANTTYRLTLHSIITTSSGGSFEFFFISSGTTYEGGTAQVGSGIQRSGGVVAGGYHYNTTSFSPLYATQNLTNGHTYGEYYFRTTATAGTAKMQFAQRSSAIAGTTTVAAGATAILEKIS